VWGFGRAGVSIGNTGKDFDLIFTFCFLVGAGHFTDPPLFFYLSFFFVIPEPVPCTDGVHLKISNRFSIVVSYLSISHILYGKSGWWMQ
jgi:hypothetical protein